MRKIASLLPVLMLLCTLVFGQTRSVSGVVTDKKGNPVPFATIQVKGTNAGLAADAAGKFTLTNVGPEVVLVISAAGMKQTEATIGPNDTFVTLGMDASNSADLQEVVVTGAFNIKRNARNVSYATQNIKAEELNTIRQPSLNSALAGKVAGAQFREQSYTKLGAQANVRLRGEAGLFGGSVLYVVDGTPVNSVDINPDDIEDLSVLKGVNATALFGDRASSGAIVITTKRGKVRPGIGLEVNLGLRFDEVYVLPKYQNDYAGGAEGDLIKFNWQPGMPDEWQALNGKYYPDYTDDASWGPRMAGQEYIPWYAWYPDHNRAFKTASLTPQPDNIKDFYSTGTTTNNNINFQKAGNDYSMRLSYTFLNIKGLIPESYQKKHTMNGSFVFDLNPHFTAGMNFSYITQDLKGQFNDLYANQSTGSFSSWFHRDLDMGIIKELRGLRAPGGYLPSWNHMNPGTYLSNPAAFYTGNYWFNFYDYFDQVNNFGRRDRIFGDVSFKYKYDNHFNVVFNARKNQVTEYFENSSGSLLDPKVDGQALNSINNTAGYSTGNSFIKEDAFELLANYSNKFNDNWSVNATGGLALRKNLSKGWNLNTVDGLAVPELYAITNSASPIGYRNDRTESEVRSVFGRADVGWKNMLFLEGNLRNDWFSTLRPEDNAILYKSIGGSFVFSDLLKNSLSWLSYGKIRASWGEVPSSLGPYDINYAYSVSSNQWNGNILMNTPDRRVDSTIRGATNDLFEIGTELRFFKSRVSLDFTWYSGTRIDEPYSLNLPSTSGFSTVLINVGKVVSKGIEFIINGKVIQGKDFGWSSTINFGYNYLNEVVEIIKSDTTIKRILLPVPTGAGAFNGANSVNSSGYAASFVGERWGQLVGNSILRENGVPVINPASGLFERDPNPTHFGSVLPDFTGGFLNQFTYKNLILNINIDFQKGGKFFSLSDFWGTFSGLTERTAELNDKGVPVRDPVAEGGGVHVVGVDKNDLRTTVDMYVPAQDYYHQFRNSFISEASIYDLTYVKMREVSLGYRLPVQKWKMSKYVQSATFSILARNPWLIYAENRDFDPSEISNTYGEDGQLPGTRSIGFNLRIGF